MVSSMLKQKKYGRKARGPSGHSKIEQAASSARGRTPIQLFNPKESEVMKQLTFYLNRRFGERGWLHVPNESLFLSWFSTSMAYRIINFLLAMGMKKNFPDILIFTAGGKEKVWDGESSIRLWVKGMAIEVKREKGGKLLKGQKEYLEYFDSIGWATAVGYGYQDTINKIEEVYGKE